MISLHSLIRITLNMSKLTFNRIIAKLGRLDEYVVYLQDLQKVNKKAFTSDYHFFGLAERYLQLSIEIVIDVGKLMVLSESLRRPEDNQDTFVVLKDQGILSESLTESLLGIVGFRNVLVHDYDKIDREIVYKKLQDNLGNFAEFKKEIVQYLDKQS